MATHLETLNNFERAALDNAGNSSFRSLVGGKPKKTRTKKTVAIASASIAVVAVIVIVILFLIFSVPLIVLASIDHGLQETLGFEATSAIIEEQAEHVLAEQMANGSVNAAYASDLEKYGVLVGQQTADGDFIRTNVYLANLDGEEIVASNLEFINHDIGSGELAILFDGEVISAHDFVGKVESSPRLYAAFANATDITTRFYYSNDVEKVYRDFGLTRNNYAKYEPTGNNEQDRKQFEEIFAGIIDRVPKLGMNGYDVDCPDGAGGCDSRNFTILNSESSADGLVGFIANNVGGDSATEKAAVLLNTAVSANEPYVAAGTFIALEEALNRARADGDGPVDPVLNTLSESNTVVVTDTRTGEDTLINNSVFGTKNFTAAVSNSSFSSDDALNYSRDRIITVTDSTQSNIINNTTIASNGSKQFNILIAMQDEGSADHSVVERSTSSVASTFYDDVMMVTKSSIGGNRIVMGGSFLSNGINARVLGAMPSDEEAVARYQNEVDMVLARRAEAERATRNPFDITSRYTFFGSLFRKMGVLLTNNIAKNRSVGSMVVSSVAGLMEGSVGEMTSSLVAAEGDSSFMTTSGDCPTVQAAASVSGDIYCTSHNTVDTTRMDWTLDKWKTELAGSIDENGDIVDNSPLAQFVALGMGRESTVGIMDSDICERWKDFPGNQSIFEKFFDTISNLFGLYKSCSGVSSDVSIGSMYTLSSSNENNANVSLYTSYVLYDTVSSLLADKKSSTTAFKEKYYAKYPRDDSAAGVIARRTGMSKGNAEIALAYRSYLIALARYNPLGRYAFGQKLVIDAGHRLLIDDNELPKVELAAADRKIMYKDLRGIVTFSA